MGSRVHLEFLPDKPHVAVIPSTGIGNITPLLEFAKHLATHHGFHVSFLYTTTDSSTAQNQQVHSPHHPPNLHVVNLPPVDLSDIVNDQTPILTRLCLNLEQSFHYLNTQLPQQHNKPQAIVIDMFCTQAFDAFKDLPNIPIFIYFTTSAHMLAFSLFLPQLDSDVEGEFVDLPEPVQVPGCKPIRITDLMNQVANRKIDEYKWCLYHFGRLPMAKGIILNTWQDVEPVTFKALRDHSFYQNIPIPPVYPIGPLIKEYEPVTETTPECLAWLDIQSSGSVLFVSFGSGGILSVEQQTELAWGLELSGQRFMWVVRAANNSNASATFFNVGGDVNDPTSYLPEGFLGRTRERGMVVMSWAPQATVLRHASTGAFLSHCGWNSTMESVANGVPMIAWPLYAEQRMNATMLEEDVGVAVKVKGEGVIGRKEIERVVRMVMEGEGGKVMKQRARELKDSAAKALEIEGSSSMARASLAKLLIAE
ncbi:hydroquinone glucosyltransferase-like [Abrus precatorius]|uniref:Glycosyltransferase n=1 Tax=Abrus precatorius TaxID=3816 RepID=A0A8B8MHI1_ABRPR|nr:hydroquinone glucosyltransferase-like [Abrus precatorius]